MPAPSALVVEHNAATGGLISEVLRERGYDVLVANTLAEGSALLETCRPQVLVIDPVLRDGDGRELIRRAKALSVRVVFESAAHDAPTKAAELDVPFLAKPFGLDELVERVG